MAWISPEEAWRWLAEGLGPQAPETVSRRRAAGRVLAAPVRATVDLPPCDMSAMDGYAVSEPVTAGSSLPVTATIAAGDGPGHILTAGSAVRIMTGAPVPAGSEAVVPVEQTDAGETTVTFSAASQSGAHIRQHGEVVRAGDEILSTGTPVTATVLGLLAAHGTAEIEVYGVPRVATLSTGDEILPPEEEPGPGQLRDTHADFLLAAGRTLHLEFQALGIARDNEADLARHIEQGLEHDVLLISGGVSKGIFDLVEDVLARYGCRTLFDAVAVQPGKPLVAARHENGWVFGLPGNPASAIVCFHLFVRPFLRTMLGFEDGYWHGALRAQLAAPLPGARKRDRFVSASVRTEDGRILVTPHSPQGSHDVIAYGHGSALVRITAHSEPTAPGESCEVLLLPG
ncbi:MAG: molybdopterin molybdotransferase MoeA [bacterium]|nr:molybdopterin molybdotransferase MoeA [bacterium]